MKLNDTRVLLNGVRNIYLISVSAIILGSCVDLYFLPAGNTWLNIIDKVSIGLYFFSLLFHFLRKGSVAFCFGIVAYTLIFNFIGYFILSTDPQQLTIDFFRYSIFVGIILTLSAYVINKNHPIIIASIYFSASIVSYFLHRDIFSVNYLFVLLGSMVVYSLLLYYFVNLQDKTLSLLQRTNNFVNELNTELVQKSEEIVSQNEVLEHQKKLIEDRNKEILTGIRFAKNVQQAVLPSESKLSSCFSNYFLFNKPKAVISGDFFWISEESNKTFVAVVDCTGHGVPGAFVSMVINTILAKAFNDLENPNPASVLNYINSSLINEFRSNETYQFQIGLDIAMISFDFTSNTLEYCGAFNPVLRIRENSMTQLSASRFIMGLSNEYNNTTLENQVLDFKKGDRFYLFSDGIIDQFGGDQNKKIGLVRLREEFTVMGHYPMDTQLQLLKDFYNRWKGSGFQTDDILVLGLEI